ncbi:MAG: hypothetical protein GX946_09840 [Oligosphaeraceae bacterium]|mgnify:CR=1 FL=1|nr:hypothetical protein [Oligosphaeraceae bacterium]
MEYLTILPAWQKALAAAGLDQLDALLSFADGECLSWHPRGKTSKYELPCGTRVFVKQDHFTKWKTTLRYMLRLQKPQPNTEKERQSFALVRELGITSPEVIAWGQRRRLGLPHQGVMVMLPMNGIDLPSYLEREPDATKRQEAITRAEATLALLQEKQLDWRTDCKPEHFFVLENDGEIGLIDLERLRLCKQPLSKKHKAMQLQRFRSLLPK